MPTFEFTSPEGKTYEVQGPNGATKEQAFSILQKQLQSAPKVTQSPNAKPAIGSQNANQIPTAGYRQAPKSDAAPAKPKDGVLGKVLGPTDAVLSLGANAAIAPFAQAGGVAGSLFGGNYGTQKGVKDAERIAGRIQGLAYTPKTKTGDDILESFGSLTDKTRLGAVIPQLPGISPFSRPAAAQLGTAAGKAAGAVADRIGSMRSKPTGMVGVGAAMTSDALRREVEAKSLPVPLNLTKGMKTRDPEQLRFERETAKNGGVGAPLRDRQSELNEGIHKNLDAFDDLTGSEKRSLREVGDSVLGALAEKDASKSAKINAAYKKAREAGQMNDPVSVKPLTDYIAENRSAAKNAPIISAVQSEIKRLTKGKGDTLSVSQMEELRKFVNKAMNFSGADKNYAPEIKRIIDGSTEGKGGDLYRQARRMSELHKREFEDHAVIRNLMDMKKGDRKVAVEDVFQKSIMSGSLDDVRHLRRVLQTSGDKGQQAWKELQGQTIRHLKDQVTKSVNLDQRKNAVVSAKAFNDMVRDMDKSGKLDFIFGKKDADQIRTLNEVAQDVLTTPEGVVNHSNTASVVAGMLDGLTMVGSHYAGHFVPAPVFTAGNFARKAYRNRQLSKQVQDALGPIPEPPRN